MPAPRRHHGRNDRRRPQLDRVATPIVPRSAIARCPPVRTGAVRQRRRSAPPGSGPTSLPHRPMPATPPAGAPSRSASASSGRCPSTVLSDPAAGWRRFPSRRESARRAATPLVQMRVLVRRFDSDPDGPDPHRFDIARRPSPKAAAAGTESVPSADSIALDEWGSRTMVDTGTRARGAGAGGALSGGSGEVPRGAP